MLITSNQRNKRHQSLTLPTNNNKKILNTALFNPYLQLKTKKTTQFFISLTKTTLKNRKQTQFPLETQEIN